MEHWIALGAVVLAICSPLIWGAMIGLREKAVPDDACVGSAEETPLLLTYEGP